MQQHAQSRPLRCRAPFPTGLQLLALIGLAASAGACNQVDWQDAIDQIDDKPQPPPPIDPCATVKCGSGTQCVLLKSEPPQARCMPVDENPCATMNCGINGQCIVLESYPPQAKCVPLEKPEPDPAKACYGSSECGDGLVCSTELGVCGSPPGCGPDRPCPAVCVGTCVPRKTDPPPPEAQCKVDSDCQLHSNYCGGCDCRVFPKALSIAQCPASDLVQCLVNPCDGVGAACIAGKCTIGTSPTPRPR